MSSNSVEFGRGSAYAAAHVSMEVLHSAHLTVINDAIEDI